MGKKKLKKELNFNYLKHNARSNISHKNNTQHHTLPADNRKFRTHFVLNNVSDISHKPILINFSDFALLKFERYLYIRCAGPPLKANEYNLFFTKEILIH